MKTGKLILVIVVGLFLTSALPALSQKENEDNGKPSAVTNLWLVQCSLAGSCIEAGHILRKIDGVEDVTVYPTASEFDVTYDPDTTTPEKIIENFNRENPGSRVELLEEKGSRSEWTRRRFGRCFSSRRGRII